MRARTSVDDTGAVGASIKKIPGREAADTLAFLAALPDSKPAQRAAAALRVLQEVGLGYLRLGQPINTLSGGESQRLKLAAHLAEAQSRTGFQPVSPSTVPAQSDDDRTIMEDRQDACPTLFVFDEPTSSLGVPETEALFRLLHSLRERGVTIVYVSHRMPEIFALADRVTVLVDGAVVASGDPAAIRDDAAVRSAYLGDA